MEPQLSDELEEVRREIARLARSRDHRIVPESPKMPCDWQPLTVTNPHTGLPFTVGGAWAFIADLCESGHPMEEKMLEKPKGDKAYVMLVELVPGQTLLYIKVQLRGGMVYGRSFHYSNWKTR
jgi:hypothetical protein